MIPYRYYTMRFTSILAVLSAYRVTEVGKKAGPFLIKQASAANGIVFW